MRILFTLFCIWISQAALAANNIEKPTLNWNGAYMGVHIGNGIGRAHFSDPFAPSLFGDSVRSPIFLGGGQVGYNWKSCRTPFLFGIEGAATGFVSDGSFTGMAFSGFYLSQNCRVQPKMIATITGRVGTLLGPKCENLVYVKGGPAWIHNQVCLATNGVVPMPGWTTMSTTYSKWGVTVGGGIEHVFTPAWTVGLEYDYLQFSDASIQVPTSVLLDIYAPEPSVKVLEGARSNAAQHIHLFKLSLNYKFGADPHNGWNPFPFLTCKQCANRRRGWDFEGGVRHWFSEGRFQKDLGQGEDPSQANSLISRLTYASRSNANEIFGRIESPYHVFLKGFGSVGSSHLHGKMNDEDWWYGEFPMYSNTISMVRGKLNYFTIDGGYDLFHRRDRKLGLFVGYNHYHENNTALGYTQIANLFCLCGEPIPTSIPMITESIKWKSLRLGLNSEMELCPRLKLAGDVAYLPYACFRGCDVHLLREDVPNQTSYEFGKGRGVQVDVSLSYLIAGNLSVGVGGRYVAMWATQDGYTNLFGGMSRRTLPIKTERFGGFLQLSYSFRS
jgi:opacity protein-like surface antigen/outer membrane protease